MTAAEALKAGYFRLHGTNKAFNSEKGETVELFTPLEAEMLEILDQCLNELDYTKDAPNLYSKVYFTIKKARGEA